MSRNSLTLFVFVIVMVRVPQLVDECDGEYLRFDLEYDEVIVLERKTASSANRDILTQHGIPQDRSIGKTPVENGKV